MSVSRMLRHLISANTNSQNCVTPFFTATPGALLLIAISRRNNTVLPAVPNFVRLSNGQLAIAGIEQQDDTSSTSIRSMSGLYLLQSSPMTDNLFRVETNFNTTAKNLVQVFEIISGSVLVGLAAGDKRNQSPEALIVGNYQTDSAVFSSGAFCGTNIPAAPATDLAAPDDFWLTANVELVQTDLVGGMWYSPQKPKRAKWITTSNSSNQGYIVEVLPGGYAWGLCYRSAQGPGTKHAFAVVAGASVTRSGVVAARKNARSTEAGEAVRSAVEVGARRAFGIAVGASLTRSGAVLGGKGAVAVALGAVERSAVVVRRQDSYGKILAESVRSAAMLAGSARFMASISGEAFRSASAAPDTPRKAAIVAGASVTRSGVVGSLVARSGGTAGEAHGSGLISNVHTSFTEIEGSGVESAAVTPGAPSRAAVAAAAVPAGAVETGTRHNAGAAAGETPSGAVVAAGKAEDGAAAGGEPATATVISLAEHRSALLAETPSSAAVSTVRQVAGLADGSQVLDAVVTALRRGQAPTAGGEPTSAELPRGIVGYSGRALGSDGADSSIEIGVPGRMASISGASVHPNARVSKAIRAGIAPIMLRGSLTDIMLKGRLETANPLPLPRRMVSSR